MQASMLTIRKVAVHTQAPPSSASLSKAAVCNNLHPLSVTQCANCKLLQLMHTPAAIVAAYL